jgi:hypothetical protein
MSIKDILGPFAHQAPWCWSKPFFGRSGFEFAVDQVHDAGDGAAERASVPARIRD